jgi:outer membrane protein assembly factor BamB
MLVVLHVLASADLRSVQADNQWTQFRGPRFDGSSPATNLPSTFSQEENVRWSMDMPGPSAATPVVYNDRIFVSSTDTSRDQLVALCFDRANGKLLWQRDIAGGIRKDTRSTYSAPTPATDGKRVVFFYGNGDLVTFDMEGAELWRKNLGPFAFMWTFSTSPLLHDGKLYMQILQRNYRHEGEGTAGARIDGIESYLLALDPETGDELWRHVRPSNAVEESLESFASPVPMQHQGRSEILIAGGDAISGHDPKTGKELWRWETWNPQRIPHWRLVPSPVYGDGVILACAPKQDPIYAVPAGKLGVLEDDSLLWISDQERALSSDVPTPAFADGDFFVLSDVRKLLSRVRPQTGEVVWSVETPGRTKYEASPTVADGKVFLVNFVGEVTVVDAASGEILQTVPMEPISGSEDQVRSGIVADGNELLIRTNTKLWCIGKPN